MGEGGGMNGGIALSFSTTAGLLTHESVVEMAWVTKYSHLMFGFLTFDFKSISQLPGI